MKATLITDMPNTCNDCQFRHHRHCDILGELSEKWDGTDEFKNRDKNCPLKPLPQKRVLPEEEVVGTNYGEEPWFTDGYNACIDEILGDNND